LYHSRLCRSGKSMRKSARASESNQKPLNFASLDQIELGSRRPHCGDSGPGINGATGRLRSELEADVTEMMKRVHPGVNSRFSPEAILIFRKIASGWGGISESPPWVRNEPTGTAGPLGSPQQVRGRMPCDHSTYLPRGSGSSEHSTDAIQIAPARGRAVHPMAAACCRPGPTGRPARVLPHCTSCGVSLSGYSN
jgi:hypothetical protein